MATNQNSLDSVPPAVIVTQNSPDTHTHTHTHTQTYMNVLMQAGRLLTNAGQACMSARKHLLTQNDLFSSLMGTFLGFLLTFIILTMTVTCLITTVNHINPNPYKLTILKF